MMKAETFTIKSPKLARVARAAQVDPARRLLALAHHIDVDALRRAYNRVRKNAAVGVDGMTKEEYGRDLERNLEDLHQRLKTMRYRHQPIRRVHIAKEGGKTRPIGISTVEDKIVQDALRELLQVIYEPLFMDCSYGFRPGRSAHDALRTLHGAIHRGEVHWVLEADIVSFFDRIDRSKLKELLQHRIADKSLMRLIGKCLHAGILEGEVIESPGQGAVQGSTLSPLVANAYLHYVLDQWFENEVKPRMKGRARLIRYGDDFILGFEYQSDAQRVRDVLAKRLARFGLDLHPDKTRLFDFRRPLGGHRGKGPATFDFLGFTHMWRRSRRGRWYAASRTRSASLRKACKAIHDWCRRHRHLSIPDQHAALKRRIQGHFNYFGVAGNTRKLASLRYAVERAWHKWLNRRSQRSRLTWERFADLLRDFPLPEPKAKRSLWQAHS